MAGGRRKRLPEPALSHMLTLALPDTRWAAAGQELWQCSLGPSPCQMAEALSPHCLAVTLLTLSLPACLSCLSCLCPLLISPHHLSVSAFSCTAWWLSTVVAVWLVTSHGAQPTRIP